MNETLGKIHFFGSFVCMNVVFTPMFIMGMAGVSRRLHDGGAATTSRSPSCTGTSCRRGARGSSGSSRFPSSSISSGASGRGEDRGESVAGHDDRVGGALAAPARQFPRGAAGVSRALAEHSVPGAAKDYSPQHEA